MEGYSGTTSGSVLINGFVLEINFLDMQCEKNRRVTLFVWR